MAFAEFVILGYERARAAPDDAEREAWMTLASRFADLAVAACAASVLHPVVDGAATDGGTIDSRETA